LQTNSRHRGRVLEKYSLPVPAYSSSTQVLEENDPDGQPLFIGYRFIEETPFILMIVKKKNELMKAWYQTRLELIVFLAGSVSIILAVILGTVTHMVRNIHLADQRRRVILHQMEYANKMASIGRMAASVAHEINNPLAIINEKAGLIGDLFKFTNRYAQDEKLQGLVQSILVSVKRAGKITKRLLTFARNLQATVEPVRLQDTIMEVMSFLTKEAEHRSIAVVVAVPEDTPVIETDRGKLEQIFLNIVNNAFGAMKDGGHLSIGAERTNARSVTVYFKDDGCGIPAEDLHRIFEPFFSTKLSRGGTGLGLSITYNLAREIGAVITVESEVGKGSCFSVKLPLNIKKQQEV
jgi:two-component system NtrC family sensor kinase